MEIPSVISGFLILNFVRTMFFSSMAALLVEFHHVCMKSMFFVLTHISFVSQRHGGGGDDDSLNERNCRSCRRALFRPAERRDEGCRRGSPTGVDIELVMERLGMRVGEGEEALRDGRCRDCFLLEAAEGVLEEKAASTEELAEAFSVFDRDGDGYVGPEEVQEVMWRLGVEEGVELEDCRRMVCAFDEDGDGRIDLAEFRKLLESAA